MEILYSKQCKYDTSVVPTSLTGLKFSILFPLNGMVVDAGEEAVTRLPITSARIARHQI
jgi:hypothetical protein